MLELAQYPMVLPRVKLAFFLSLQQLELKEQLDELIVAFNVRFKVKVKQCFYAFEALGELAHGRIVDGVAPVGHVLRNKDLAHTHEQVSCILFEQRLYADVKLLVPFDCVGIVEDGGDQMAVLDVHVLEPVSLLLPVELIEQCLLKVDPLNVKNLNEALVVALVAE